MKILGHHVTKRIRFCWKNLIMSHDDYHDFESQESDRKPPMDNFSNGMDILTIIF